MESKKSTQSTLHAEMKVSGDIESIPPQPQSLSRQYTIVGGTIEKPVYNIPEGMTPETYVHPEKITTEEILDCIEKGLPIKK